MTEAQTAALTVGNVNVGEQVTGIVTSLDETLKGVTDAPSAEAAVPDLKDINAKLDQLSATVSQLPGDGKKVLADVLSKRVAELKTLAAEVTAKQGVGPVVKPALDAGHRQARGLGAGSPPRCFAEAPIPTGRFEWRWRHSAMSGVALGFGGTSRTPRPRLARDQLRGLSNQARRLAFSPLSEIDEA